jgi:hypothetical protein
MERANSKKRGIRYEHFYFQRDNSARRLETVSPDETMIHPCINVREQKQIVSIRK